MRRCAVPGWRQTSKGSAAVSACRRCARRSSAGGSRLVRELRIDAGEDLAADVVLSEVGEPQEITIPAGGGFKPIGNLLASLQELGVSP